MRTLLLLCFIALCPFALQAQVKQVPNSGFESWTTVSTYENPNDWITNNTSSSAPVVKTADHSGGNYAMRINQGGYAMSTILNAQPDMLHYYIKRILPPNDTMTVSVTMYSGKAMPRVVKWEFNSSAVDANFQEATLPIYAATVYDSVQVRFTSGKLPGSTLMVDDVTFGYLLGIDPLIKPSALVYPNPMTDKAILKFDNPADKSCTLAIYDINGRLVDHMDNIHGNAVTISRGNMTAGTYYYKLTTDNLVVDKGKLLVK